MFKSVKKEVKTLVLIAGCLSVIALFIWVCMVLTEHYPFESTEIVEAFNKSEQSLALKELNIVRIEASERSRVSCESWVDYRVVFEKEGQQYTLKSKDIDDSRYNLFDNFPDGYCLKSFAIYEQGDGYHIEAALNKPIIRKIDTSAVRYSVASSMTNIVNKAIRVTQDAAFEEKDLDGMFKLTTSENEQGGANKGAGDAE